MNCWKITSSSRQKVYFCKENAVAQQGAQRNLWLHRFELKLKVACIDGMY